MKLNIYFKQNLKSNSKNIMQNNEDSDGGEDASNSSKLIKKRRQWFQVCSLRDKRVWLLRSDSEWDSYYDTFIYLTILF